MKHFVLILSGCFFLSSCTSTSIDLDGPATKIPLKASVTKEQLQGFERAKQIVCELGANGYSDASNEEACENHLRNEAARIGAEFVVLESKASGSSTYYKKLCNNCQFMSGWAYVKKSAQSKKDDEKTRDFLDDKKDPLAASEKDQKDDGSDGVKSEEDSKPKRVVVRDSEGVTPFSFDLDVASVPRAPSASAPGKSSFGKGQKAMREPTSKGRGRTKLKKKPVEKAPEAPQKSVDTAAERGIDSVSNPTKQLPNQPANAKAQPKK